MLSAVGLSPMSWFPLKTQHRCKQCNKREGELTIRKQAWQTCRALRRRDGIQQLVPYEKSNKVREIVWMASQTQCAIPVQSSILERRDVHQVTTNNCKLWLWQKQDQHTSSQQFYVMLLFASHLWFHGINRSHNSLWKCFLHLIDFLYRWLVCVVQVIKLVKRTYSFRVFQQVLM